MLLSEYDIPPAKNLSNSLENYVVHIYDPILVDKAKKHGIRNIKFVTWDRISSYKEACDEAHSNAGALENEVDSALGDLGFDLSISSWQHLNWYYFFIQTSWYLEMWEGVLGDLSEHRLHVFVCDRPQQYYFDSFLPSLLLIKCALERSINIITYVRALVSNESGVVPDLSGISTEVNGGYLLVHIPTCFYDVTHFNQELTATGKRVVNIESPLFNVDAYAHTNIALAPLGSVELLRPEIIAEVIVPFADRIKKVLLRRLRCLLGVDRYVEEQSDYAAAHYVRQLFTFLKLKEYFASARPEKLIISDHDTGFHGPLVSFAKLYDIPVVTLPHSKVTYDVRYRYEKIVSLTHAIQGADIKGGSGQSVPSFQISFPAHPDSRVPEVRDFSKIGILLNAVSLNGVLLCNYASYIEGLRELFKCCFSIGIPFEVRNKPGYSITSLMKKDLALADVNISPEGKSLAEFAAGCDLCLMFDSPTSAALEFLHRGIPILNPVTQDLAYCQSVGAHPDIVPRKVVKKIIEDLIGFSEDKQRLSGFAALQKRRFIERMQKTKAARSYM